MYQLTNDPNVVTDLETGGWITVDSGTWQANDYAKWLAAGNTPDPEPPPDSPLDDSTSAEYQFALRSSWVQSWMDTTAQQNYYIDAASCISYTASEVEVYADDAQAMTLWRDALWPAFNAMPAGWPADPMQWPLWDAIQPLLPQPADYGWTLHDPVGAPPGFAERLRGVRI